MQLHADRSVQAPAFHWPALDGLRGIAVIAVLLFHAFSDWTPNGFTGVDVFFGLSGFLITALLMREHSASGRISLPKFYMRRILRLFPALVAACLGVLALATVSGNLDEGLPAVLAALFYVAHIWIYTGHSGWLLEHTWTLSLEEHYYLVWPALLICFLGRRLHVRLLGVAGALAILLILAADWPLPEGVGAAYERGAPMIYGSVAALLWWRFRTIAPLRAAGWLGNFALLTTVVLLFLPHHVPAQAMMGLTSVPGILSVVIVVGFVLSPRALGARSLDYAPLRWTGRRAYGLYLYHFPVLSVLTHQVDLGLPLWARALVGIALSFAVTAASYRWLELPFLRLKSRFRTDEDRTGTASVGAPEQAGPV